MKTGEDHYRLERRMLSWALICWRGFVVRDRERYDEQRFEATGFIGDAICVLVFAIAAIESACARRAQEGPGNMQTIKTKSGRTIRLPSDAEDAAIQRGIKSDADAREWTDEMFKQAVPFSALPESLQTKLREQTAMAITVFCDFGRIGKIGNHQNFGCSFGGV
jgi:hypothetical protein